MTTAPVTIVGNYLSPYVRKVLVALDIKGIPYEIDPIVPFFGNDEFSRLSPLRRIPVLMDDKVTLTDSTVICEYLEDRYPKPALFPKLPEQRARARWLEEFADTRMGEVFIWCLFAELVVRRAIWGKAPNEEMLRKTREVEIPQVLDYLESELPGAGFLFGEITIADISVAAFFCNVAFCKQSIDSGRWPKTVSFVSHLLEHPSFTKLRPFEELLMRTPIPQQRDALRDAGAPLSARHFGDATPRRGVMNIV